MNIALAVGQGDAAAQWGNALVQHLPHAQWINWHEDAPLCDYALVWSPPERLFSQQTALKAVFTVSAGVERVLRVPNLPVDIPVVRLEDAGMATQMAHYALWAVTRHIYGFDALQVAQRAGQWAHQLYANADAQPVGVLGLGALGMHVAHTLAAAGFGVNGYSATPKQLEGVRCFYGTQLPEFAAATRLLIILAPHTPQTHHMVNVALLGQLMQPAYIINLARGALVDDAALLAALDAGTVAGATLDVFNTEPLPAGHAYWQHPKVTITPHIAAKTVIEPSVAQIAEKILALEAGRSISGVVDRARGY
jgi:glyoxylate/hydroxypyruvate reductase